MSINKYIISLFTILIVLSSCREDTVEENLTGTLVGTILSTQNGDPLENASVSTNPTTTSVNTDADGKFRLEDVLIGTYAVIISKEGFVNNSISLTLETDEVKEFTVNLASDSRFNRPPTPPEMLSPGMDVMIESFDSVQLIWSSIDLDDDEMLFSVRLYDETLEYDKMIVTESQDTSFVFTEFDLGKRYFWQVLVKDEINQEVRSEAYSFRTPDYPDYPYYYVSSVNGGLQIFTTDMDRPLQLTESAVSYRPRMNHAGNQLAFISSPDADPQVFISDDNGENRRQLTTVGVKTSYPDDADFAWNNTDTKIYYPSLNRIYSLNTNGTGLETVILTTAERFVSKVAHHPSQNRIAYIESSARNTDAHVIYYDLNRKEILDTIFSAISGRVGGLDFSPDGLNIVYTHDVSLASEADGRRFDSRVFEYDFNTGVPNLLSLDKPSGTNDLDPKYNSTGSKVIFTNVQNDSNSQSTIMKVDRDGTNRDTLIDNAAMIGIRKF